MSTILEVLMESAFERQFRNGKELQPGTGNVRIRLEEGTITLFGFVHSEAEQIAAEKAAKFVYGLEVVRMTSR
jgi:hypothetical protein